ncbi:MAG: hypothetical protein B7Y41_05160 [Hydrogenophilales bacterium 28-61-23]|nr:MAG: hypothetical protein B7Y41_05160 [Hydrogenophilales bacterium 28-61-23]
MRQTLACFKAGLVWAVFAGLAGCTEASSTRDFCPDNVWTESAGQISVTVVPGSPVRNDFGPGFFGFNLPWFQFQDGLMSATDGAVPHRDLAAYLSRFSGAYYRYPGGTFGNYFDWKSAVGPVEARVPQKATGWSEPRVIRFGIPEYISFLESVQGRPWYVVNLFGRFRNELELSVLQAESQGLFEHIQQLAVSHPAQFREIKYELGNELDRDAYGWSAEKYTKRATAIGRQFESGGMSSPQVVPLEDFDALPGRSASEYNRAVVGQLPESINDYALHPYYAGRPGGPPVDNRLRHICAVLEDIQAVRPGSQPGIWLTEHARWPKGKVNSDEWKANKPRTNNLDAALHVGDFLIGAAQIAPIKSTFLHALHANDAPWALFVRDYKQDKLIPTAVYLGLVLFREGMAEQVLPSKMRSTNTAKIDGGHDARALVMQTPDQGAYKIWLVNHADRKNEVTVKIPALVSRTLQVEHKYLAHADASANNSTAQPGMLAIQTSRLQVQANAAGEIRLTVPMHSLSAITLIAVSGQALKR